MQKVKIKRINVQYAKNIQVVFMINLNQQKLNNLTVIEHDIKVNIIKKRFICHKCNKKFTEQVDLNQKGKTISNKLEQKLLKDLLNYNLSIKYIAKINNISSYTVRNILLTAMSEYPEHIRNLPKVISFDEFKANTNEGKYAFIINDSIHYYQKEKKST